MKKLKTSERWTLLCFVLGAVISGILLAGVGLQYWWGCLIVGFGIAGVVWESHLKTAARAKIIDGG